MKLLLLLLTLGLAAFVILRRRRPELAEREEADGTDVVQAQPAPDAAEVDDLHLIPRGDPEQ